MNNDIFNGKVKDVLAHFHMTHLDKGQEIITHCVFNDCDKGKKQLDPTGHLYFSSTTGQYDCKKCGSTGNLWTLCEFQGMTKEEVIDKFGDRPRKRTQEIKPKPAKKEKLSHTAKKYLHGRGVSNEIIQKAGLHEEKKKIMVPVRNEEKETLFHKKRAFLTTDKAPKSMLEKGAKQNLFGLDFKSEWKDELVICEGEMDYLLLLSEGIQAVSPTNGAKQKFDKFVQNFYSIKRIYVCYDVEEKGADKVLRCFLDLLGSKEIYRIDLPESLGEGGDITDYWKQKELWEEKGFKASLLERSHLVDLDSDGEVVKVEDLKPKSSYSDLISKLSEHSGEEYTETFEIVFASILSVFLPMRKDPLWLLLVAPPSSGKTQMLNLFLKLKWIKRLDNITPKSFISGHVDKKMQNDLLKELDQGCLIIKDYSSSFSKSEETLKEMLGDLTNIYDGEFAKHSAGRATVTYNAYFSHIGAVTPQTLKKRESYLSILGARFLHIQLPEHTQSKRKDIMDQILSGNGNYDTEKELQEVISSHARYWKHRLSKVDKMDFENSDLRVELMLVAKFISHSRGVVVYPDYREKLPYEVQDSQVEAPYRVLSQLIKLLYVITTLRGKKSIGKAEVNIAKKIALQCMTLDRAEIMEIILRQDFLGITDNLCSEGSKKSHKTYQRRLKELVFLDILEVKQENSKHHYYLKKEYQKLFESFGQKAQEKLLL